MSKASEFGIILRPRHNNVVKKSDKKTKNDGPSKPERPLLRYTGAIGYFTTLIDCASICDKLLNEVNKTESTQVFGFDLEWYFNFQTGPGRTAVIQISPNLQICYILHVALLDNLPKALSELLIHPNIRLTGVNIKNDVRKLARDFKGFDGDKIIENCIELSTFANTVLPIQQRWSLEKLINHCLEMDINKDSKIRRSRWHEVPLSTEQQCYAALDAQVSLRLYSHLKKLESQEKIEEDTFENEQDTSGRITRCSSKTSDF